MLRLLHRRTMFVLLCIPVLGTGAQQRDALLLYREGQYQRAVDLCLEELNERGRDQAKRRMDSYTVLGWSYLKLGEYEKALNSALAARKEIRYDIRIIEIEGEANYYLGRNSSAMALFEEYVSLNNQVQGSRIDTVYYLMGEIFLRFAEYQHADIAFTTALHYSPRIAQWWARLGYACEQIPDLEKAKSAYGRALELQPSLEDARAGLERLL